MAGAKFDVPPLLRAWADQSNESKRSFRLWNAGLFFAFFSMQVAAGVFLLSFGAAGHSPLFFRAYLGLLVLFLLADAVFVRGIMRSKSFLSIERGIEESEQNLQLLLEEYESMNLEMRQIARLRHDARNHLQAIASLSEKGEQEAARVMAEGVANRYLKEHVDV